METSGASAPSPDDVRIGDVWRELRFPIDKWPRGRVDVVDVVEIQGTRVVFYEPIHLKDPIRVPFTEFVRRFELRYREGVTPREPPPPAPGPESTRGMEGMGGLAAAAKAKGVEKLFEQPFEYDEARAAREREHAKAQRVAERGRREQRAAEPPAASGPLVPEGDLPF